MLTNNKPESVLKNETYKIFCDFDIQTDQPIQAKKVALINMEKIVVN